MHVFDTWHTRSFSRLQRTLTAVLLDDGEFVETASWQGVEVASRPEMTAWEVRHVSFEFDMPHTVEAAQGTYRPNLPWAEMHFEERVGGKPVNPPPSHEFWPHAQGGNGEFRQRDRFSHTYPERFWPKYAGEQHRGRGRPHTGIRFNYGDLHDVLQLLRRDPFTRQAYLPVWFPEDTGTAHGQRVPCTLGYHFLQRHGRLDCTYSIRSCDFRRHFPDDVYLATRLAQWVAAGMGQKRPEEAQEMTVTPGKLIMHVGSFHCFAGDLEMMRHERRVSADAALRDALG